MAAYRPELVKTLTLVSPALPDLRPRRGTDPRLALLLLPGLAEVAGRQLRKQSPDARARAVLELCFGDPSVIAPQRLAEAVDEARRRTGLPHAETAFLRSLRGLVAAQVQRGPHALWRQAASVSAPTLLVWGDRDRLVDVSVAPRAARAFADSRLLVLEGVGHVAQMERPETVARAFLALRADAAARHPGRAHPAAS